MNDGYYEVGFMRLPKVLTKIPVSKSRWWAGVKKQEFPQPVKLGKRCTMWRVSDIEALCKKLGGAA